MQTINIVQQPEHPLKRSPRKPKRRTASTLKRKNYLKIITYVLIFTSLSGGIAYAMHIYKNSFLSQNNIKISSLQTLDQNPQDVIKTDSTGHRTNILLVGIDTRSSDPTLQNTDTIIVGSYDYNTHNVVGISIPRDLFVEIPGTKIFTKINAVYKYGEQQTPGGGLPLLAETVEQVTGLEIQYYGMVDLQGFVNFIDMIDGVDVNVERSFTDYYYPSSTPGVPYRTVSFTEGWTHMDGATALEFARSRHSQDPYEGSDFARAKRQQLLLIAIKDKLLTKEILLNPVKIFNLLNEFNKHIEYSEITTDEIQAGIQLLKENNFNIYSFVLDTSIGNFQILTDHSGLTGNIYGIVPLKGYNNYEDLHEYIQYTLKYPEIYQIEPVIYTYDIGIGYYTALEETTELQNTLPYLPIIYAGTLYYDKTGSYIYEADTIPAEIVEQILEIYTPNSVVDITHERPEYVPKSLNGEDITILFGKNTDENIQEEQTQQE